jgi:LacI family transcriptional regulator
MTPERPRLGVITNDQHAVFQRSVIAGVNDVASQHDYDVIVDSIAEDPANPRPVSLTMESLAGVLIVANALPDERLHKIYRNGLPMTLVSHFVPDVPVPAIVSDNTQGIAQLVSYLVDECHCRRIVFIQGNMEQRDGIKRDLAFRQELLRHDLEIRDDYFLRGDFDVRVAGSSLRDFLQKTVNFDAVLASDYLMAVETIKILRETQFLVPEDVCVVGFGDGPESAEAGLTTVAANIVDVGRRATRQLMGQIGGLRIQGLTILSTTLVERDSCCKRVNQEDIP